MCDPLTIAGIALTAGSTVANTIATNKVQAARADAMAAERIRQNGFQHQADAINTQSQDRYQNFEGQQDQKASALGQYFKDQNTQDANANTVATNAMTMPQSSSNIVNAEETKQLGKAKAFTDQQGNALGELRSFGDLMGTIGRGQARDAGQIGQIGSFMRGSSGVLPYELDAANNAGNGIKLLGDVLGLGGTLALGKGLSGGSGVTNYASPGTFPAAPAMPAGAIADRAPSNLYSLYSNQAGLF